MNESVKREISSIINFYEKKLGIRVLFWCLHGSKGCGREYIGSDYDIAFVYMSDKVEQRIPFIHEINQGYGIDALNLYDVLMMLKKHYSEFNIMKKPIAWDSLLEKEIPSLDYRSIFHWLKSPILVERNDSFGWLKDKLFYLFYDKDVLFYYFSRIKGNYSKFLQDDQVLIKRYLRTFHGIFTCRWILDMKEPAPMEFSCLFEKYADDQIIVMVQQLIESYRKSENGNCKIKKSLQLNQYIEKQIIDIGQRIKILPYQCEIETFEIREFYNKV